MIEMTKQCFLMCGTCLECFDGDGCGVVPQSLPHLAKLAVPKLQRKNKMLKRYFFLKKVINNKQQHFFRKLSRGLFCLSSSNLANEFETGLIDLPVVAKHHQQQHFLPRRKTRKTKKKPGGQTLRMNLRLVRSISQWSRVLCERPSVAGFSIWGRTDSKMWLG